jgi:hypothetical protein
MALEFFVGTIGDVLIIAPESATKRGSGRVRLTGCRKFLLWRLVRFRLDVLPVGGKEVLSMQKREKRFLVKTNIIGGGLSLSEGEVVEEAKLGIFAAWLSKHGGIEEIAEPTKSHPLKGGRPYLA